MRIDIPLLTCVIMACGCVYVPQRNPTLMSAKLGTDASAAVRPGESDRQAVIATFGEPDYRSAHDLAFGYTFEFIKGTRYGFGFGPCGPGLGYCDNSEMDDLWLAFDDSGILRRYEKHLVSRFKLTTSGAWEEFLKSVPDTVVPKKNYSTTQLSHN